MLSRKGKGFSHIVLTPGVAWNFQSRNNDTRIGRQFLELTQAIKTEEGRLIQQTQT